jgi:N-acetylmuramoyl-L-alanine amidase
MHALEGLLTDIVARWSIRPERVLGHSDIAPDRKADPGPMFDWNRLAEAGLAVWPGVAEPGAFFQDLSTIGYRAQGDENPEDELLAAFRLRFLPDAFGPLDDTDRAMAAALARDYPCIDPDTVAP